MAINYIQKGDVLQHTPAAAVASGDVVVMGARVGVALTDIAAGQAGAVQVEGVFELPKVAADVIGQGDLVYWDAAAGNITTTSTGNTLAGYAAADAAAGATLIHVNLNA